MLPGSICPGFQLAFLQPYLNCQGLNVMQVVVELMLKSLSFCEQICIYLDCAYKPWAEILPFSSTPLKHLQLFCIEPGENFLLLCGPLSNEDIVQSSPHPLVFR